MIVEVSNYQSASGARVGRASRSNGFRRDGLMRFSGTAREETNERYQGQMGERLRRFHKLLLQRLRYLHGLN